tara:strand:- start:5091 stop:5726 length:636 start_codon:yes stop_codon:yes gene_type:complete
MGGEEMDPNVLVMGVNPGETRVAIGKSILGIGFALFVFTLFGRGNFLIASLILLAIGYGVTSGQQYVLDGHANVLKKRNLIFLRPTDWKELGKISNIHKATRRKSSSDDGEAMNSWIDFHFKDGSKHVWSLYYGDSEFYRNQINIFLERFHQKDGAATPSTAPLVSLTDSKPAQSAKKSASVWEQSPQTIPNASPSTGFWDSYESEDKTQE